MKPELQNGVVWELVKIAAVNDTVEPRYVRCQKTPRYRRSERWRNDALHDIEGFNPAINDVAFTYYSYYGHKTHRSRVFKLKGLTAPSFVRPRLRGWGFSIVESAIRSINQHIKGADTLLMQNGYELEYHRRIPNQESRGRMKPEIQMDRFEEEKKKVVWLTLHFFNKCPLEDVSDLDRRMWMINQVMIAMQPGVTKWDLADYSTDT